MLSRGSGKERCNTQNITCIIKDERQRPIKDAEQRLLVKRGAIPKIITLFIYLFIYLTRTWQMICDLQMLKFCCMDQYIFV
jgi:hypothetical protein